MRFRAPNFQTIHNTHAKPQLLLARNGQSRKGWGNAALMPPLPSNEEPQQANSLKKSEMKVGDITKRADSVSVHTNCPRMAVQNYRAGKMKQQALGRLRSPAVGVEKKKKSELHTFSAPSEGNLPRQGKEEKNREKATPRRDLKASNDCGKTPSGGGRCKRHGSYLQNSCQLPC